MAALLELLPAAAQTYIIPPGLYFHCRVDEVPAPIVLYEGGLLAVAVFTAAVMPACGKGDEGVFRLAAEYLRAFHLKAQPGALGTPGADGVAVQAGLLRGQGGGHQVVHQAQDIGAVARAHQRRGAGGRVAGVIMAAAGIQQVATTAWANGCTHRGYHQYFPKFSGLAQKRALSQSGTCL